MNTTTYTYEEMRAEAKRFVSQHIQRLISTSAIKEKSPEWYALAQLKTNVDDDKS